MSSSRAIWSTVFNFARPKKATVRKDELPGEVSVRPLRSALRSTNGNSEASNTHQQTIRFEVDDDKSSTRDDTKGQMCMISPQGDDLGPVTKLEPLTLSTSAGLVRILTGVWERTSELVVLKELSVKPDVGAKATGNEAKIWIEANENDSILAFLGFCTGPSNNVYLVSPYMKHGDLARCLKAGFACASRDLANYVDQILDGVMFLHDVKGIVHGDLKAENVLITDELKAVITDFGLSRHAIRSEGEPVTESHIRTLATGRYLALEHHIHKIVPYWGAEPFDRRTAQDPDDLLSKSTEGDIWAFGTLVLQMYTRQQPWKLLRQDAIKAHLLRGQRPEFPLERGGAQDRGLDFHMWFIMQKCWSHFPSHRPCASNIAYWRHVGPPSLRTAEAFDYKPARSMIYNRVEDLSAEVLTAWPQGPQFAPKPYIDHEAFVHVDGYLQTPAYWVSEESQSRGALRVLVIRRNDACALDEDGWAEDLLRELETWSSISHQNLVPLLGRCKLGGVWHAVAPYWTSLRYFKYQIELVEHGTRRYATNRNVLFLRVLRDIARALQFLHSQRPPIVHGAVNLDNIVMGDRGRLHETPDTNVDACLGEYRYMHTLPLGTDETASEVKKDVLGFGMLMKELLHNRFTLIENEHIEHDDALPALRQSSLLTDLFDLCTTEVEESRATMESVLVSLVDAVNADAVGDLQ